MLLFDIPTPSEPKELYHTEICKETKMVCVKGEYIYVADGHNSFLILEKIAPETQELISFPIFGHLLLVLCILAGKSKWQRKKEGKIHPLPI